MPSEDSEKMAVLQGTLDLIVLRTLDSMGPQHAYAIATRIQQLSEDLLYLNQGTLYPALVRLEQQGRVKGSWGKTSSNREARYYAITPPGKHALAEETKRWRRMAGLIERLLTQGA
jgi:transcriptional regulator